MSGFLAALLGLASILAAATEPRLEVEASKTEVAVGERFVVELRLEGPKGTEWTVPAEPGTERVDLTPAPLGDEPPPEGVHRYQASAFALTEAEVPPISVRYRLPDGSEGELVSEPIPLRILSVLPKDPEEQKLIDIRSPRGVGIGAPFWVIFVLSLLLVAGLAAWLIHRLRRARQPEDQAVTTISADVEALERLERLAASGLLSRGEFRVFYIELTQIAKTYLERRLEAPILEMTSAETVAFLRESHYGRKLAAPMRELAVAADQVKFARGTALAEEAERHLSAVRDCVRQLEARFQPSLEQLASGAGKRGEAA